MGKSNLVHPLAFVYILDGVLRKQKFKDYLSPQRFKRSADYMTPRSGEIEPCTSFGTLGISNEISCGNDKANKNDVIRRGSSEKPICLFSEIQKEPLTYAKTSSGNIGKKLRTIGFRKITSKNEIATII